MASGMAAGRPEASRIVCVSCERALSVSIGQLVVVLVRVLGGIRETSVSILHLCCVIAVREDGTTALPSMSLDAFEQTMKTILCDVLSQYPLSSSVERSGSGRPLLSPPPVSGMSLFPGKVS